MSVFNLFEKITRICLGMASLIIMMCAACNTIDNDKSGQHTTWENYGGGADQSKYVVLNDITKLIIGKVRTGRIAG